MERRSHLSIVFLIYINDKKKVVFLQTDINLLTIAFFSSSVLSLKLIQYFSKDHSADCVRLWIYLIHMYMGACVLKNSYMNGNH